MKDKWIICPTCKGKGTTVNPAIDANGLSQEMMEDEDFLDGYMSGVYDQPCRACNGTGKMLESRIEELRDAAEDRKIAAMEDGDAEAYGMAGDWRLGA